MTKIAVDKDLIGQAIDALRNHQGNYKLSKAERKKQEAVEDALRAARAEPAVEPVAKHCMPHGWVINWLHPDGGTRPVYHPSSIQPKFGNDMKPDMYPVYTSPPPPVEPAVAPVEYQYRMKRRYDDAWGKWCKTTMQKFDEMTKSPVYIAWEPWRLETRALYASPPPPAEVPLLTYDEMVEAHPVLYGLPADDIEFARAVEQAVRQKAGLP